MDSDFDFDTPVVSRRKGGKPSAKPAPTTVPAPTPPVTEENGDVNAEAPAEAAPEKPKYDPDELAAIFDEILFSGEYSEQITIKGKLSIVFRTRTAEELRDISRIVDGTSATFASTLDGVRSLLQLQYALVMYGGKDLRGLKQEEKAKFVGRLPGPVVAALLRELGKFDDKVFAACQEGEANF